MSRKYLKKLTIPKTLTSLHTSNSSYKPISFSYLFSLVTENIYRDILDIFNPESCDTILIFSEPRSPPTKKPYSRRKVPSYIFTLIRSCLADVGFPIPPLTRKLGFFFSFLFPVLPEDDKCGASSTIIQKPCRLQLPLNGTVSS